MWLIRKPLRCHAAFINSQSLEDAPGTLCNPGTPGTPGNPCTPGTLTKLLVIAITVEIKLCHRRTDGFAGIGARDAYASKKDIKS